MTDPEDQARLARLQEIREGMETLRIEALVERGGKTFSTEETLELIRRHDLAADTMTIEDLIDQTKRHTSAGS